MATTLSEGATLAASVTLRQRVQVAMVKAALAVQGEDASGLTLPDGSQYIEKRASLANRVLLSSKLNLHENNLLTAFTFAVVAGGTLTVDESSISDGDIEFLVNSVFSDIAGVNQSELPT